MGIATTFPSIGVCHLVRQRFFVIFRAFWDLGRERFGLGLVLHTQRNFSIKGGRVPGIQRSSFFCSPVEIEGAMTRPDMFWKTGGIEQCWVYKGRSLCI